MNTIKVSTECTLTNQEYEKETKVKYVFAITEAISFSEAENIVFSELGKLGGVLSYKINGLSKVDFSEIVFDSEDMDGKLFYTVTICVAHVLENGKTKKQKINYLVAAESTVDASEILVKKVLNDAVWDYTITKVVETNYTHIISAVKQ
ncbi:MAG: DUF4494 family protein [Bacteroidales bacterium]